MRKRFVVSKRKSAAPGIGTIRKGLTHLEQGEYEGALREFLRVATFDSSSTPRMIKSVAAFYAYNTDRLRKEHKKKEFGNSRIMSFDPRNAGQAWSDVDIAAVLVSQSGPNVNKFLSAFLGRSYEAVRFQRRYASRKILPSWREESGRRYTRRTQAVAVAHRLGVA